MEILLFMAILLGAVKKTYEKINHNSSARVGAVSCVCEYTETVTLKAE